MLKVKIQLRTQKLAEYTEGKLNFEKESKILNKLLER